MKAENSNTDVENLGPSSRRYNFKLAALAGTPLSESMLTDSGNVDHTRKLSSATGVCQVHEAELCYCKECEGICCVQCEDMHLKHQTVSLEDVSRIHKDRLTAEIEKVRCLIRYSIFAISDLRSYIEKMTANLTDINKDILEQTAGNIREDATVFAEALLGDTEAEQKNESQRIHDKIGEFETFVSSSKSIAMTCETLINMPDDIAVTVKVDLMLTRIRTLESSLPEFLQERCIYILSPASPTTPNESSSSGATTGQFVKIHVPWRKEVKRTAILRPEVPFSSRFVTTMCPATNGDVWVVWHWGPHIYLVDQTGTIKKTINAGSKLDDICVDGHGHLVASCHADKCIKIIDTDTSDIINTINVEEVPRGIDSVSENEIVACCVQNLHHRNGDKSVVSRITTDCSDNSICKTTLSSSENFIQPLRISRNINGDICVSDRNKGAVLILDASGRLKATYTGPDSSTRHPFAPHGICCDGYGQILVVDYANHTVHVLDPAGRFRGFLIMDTELEKRAIFMGTSSPFSITIDNEGDIWIGNKFGYLTVLKYVS